MHAAIRWTDIVPNTCVDSGHVYWQSVGVTTRWKSRSSTCTARTLTTQALPRLLLRPERQQKSCLPAACHVLVGRGAIALRALTRHTPVNACLTPPFTLQRPAPQAAAQLASSARLEALASAPVMAHTCCWCLLVEPCFSWACKMPPTPPPALITARLAAVSHATRAP
jgi:hypothetical protein